MFHHLHVSGRVLAAALAAALIAGPPHTTSQAASRLSRPLGATTIQGRALARQVSQVWVVLNGRASARLRGYGGHMDTSFTVYNTGSLFATTHTWEDTRLRGFRGAVAVELLGAANRELWVSPTQHYGVDGCWIGTCNRRDFWSAQVPPEVLSQVKSFAIFQVHDSRPMKDIINDWTHGIVNVAEVVVMFVKLF